VSFIRKHHFGLPTSKQSGKQSKSDPAFHVVFLSSITAQARPFPYHSAQILKCETPGKNRLDASTASVTGVEVNSPSATLLVTVMLILFSGILCDSKWRITEMQKTIRFGIAPRHRAAIVGASLFVFGAATFAQTVPSADELVSKNTEALGGSEKIRAIQSIKASGRLIHPSGAEFPLTIYLKRPGLMRMEVNVQGKSMIQTFDGNDTWSIGPMNGSEEPRKGDETELQRAREDADAMIGGDLFDYKVKGSKLEFAGNEDVDGRPAYKLKLVTRYGTVKYIYLDTATFLEIKTVTIRSHNGREMMPEEYPSDYKPVAGVMIAHSEGLRGETQAKMVFDKIEANVVMEDSLFKPGVPTADGAPKKTPPARVTSDSGHSTRL